jgi:glutamyl-tRNA synthetase
MNSTTTKLNTRFAPSPTGLLHVGQARTALFSYCLARKTGGRFVLRIEDTDRERHIEEAVPRIMDDLRWLGMEWDEGVDIGGPNGPYRQSERLDVYAKYVQQLLDAGKAYYAFDSEEELAVLRKEAEAARRAFKYRRPATLPTAADAEAARRAGRPVVVRFLCAARDVTIHDDAFGDVTMPAAEMDDFVIQKADGWPVYHTANVIDDALMGVNYIVRGQEFLGQTWRHVLLREAWGFAEPAGYCHLPLILNPDNSKMSKRDKHKLTRLAVKSLVAKNAWTLAQAAAFASTDEPTLERWLEGADTAIDLRQLEALAKTAGVRLPEIDLADFRKSGYLPEAIANFVALMGWNPGGDREKFTLAELIEMFAPDRIGKANAKFDRAKLLAFNTDYLAAATEDRKLAALKEYLPLSGSPIPAGDEALLRTLLRANATIRTLADIPAKCDAMFVADDAYAFDSAAVEKNLRKCDGAGFAVLAELRPLLEGCEWTGEAVEKMLEGFCASHNLGMGKVAQPLRVAVTGTTISPPIYDTLTILGKPRTLARIDRCLKTR